MESHSSLKYNFLGPYLWAGLALGLAYWIFDAGVMVLILREGTWSEQLLAPTADETYMRAFTWVVFILCGGTINMLLNRQKATSNQHKDITRILENSLNEIFIFDAKTLKFRLVNRGARENIGYSMEELVELTPLDIKPEMSPEIFTKLITPLGEGQQEIIIFKTVHRRKDGTDYPVEIHLQSTTFADKPAYVAIILDTSDRDRVAKEKQKLEEQIQHAQKLESLGVLAGGIAHDFNNLLASILGNADLAISKNISTHSDDRNLQAIIKAAQRAADLCNQLLAYSGKGRFVIQQINLSDLVDEMLELLEVSISKNVTLNVQLSHDLSLVEADASQIQQIVMNLITNASEAIGSNKGVVSITTGEMECDETYLRSNFIDDELAEGLYVYMEVTDTGEGMDEEKIAQIFDPFFTSKFTGRGLGLAAVLGIIRGHKGSIRVYSELGKGTSFKFLLPASDQPLEEFQLKNETEQKWMGSGQALVVDDDSMIREMAGEFLEDAGFGVLMAKDGKEGVELFLKHADKISVVLLDMTMPEMSGEDAFREMRRINSTIPVILSSGYNEQEATNLFVGKGLAGFIQKPYRMNKFISIVRQAVN